MMKMNWNPPLDIWIIALVGLVALIMSARFVWRSETLSRSWLRGPVWGLRMAAIALLLAILGNPVRQDVVRSHPGEARDVVLVDTSASMALEKPKSRFARALDWSRAVEKASPDGQTCRIFGFADEVGFEIPSASAGVSTRLAHALQRVLESDPEQRLANIVVVSDGRLHDRDELAAVLAQARQRGVAISTHTVGGDEALMNVYIRACHVERSAPAGATVSADVEIVATGLERGAELEMTLKDETGATLASTPVTLRDGAAEKQLTFKAGLRSAPYTVSITRLDGELTHADNDFTFTLEVADPKIRVLYFEGSNDIAGGMNDERWNYNEYMVNAWKRAGDIQCDMFVVPRGRQYTGGRTLAYVRGFDEDHWPIHDAAHGLPTTRAEWFGYDVIICSDVLKDNFTPEQLDWVVEFVTERGGGFCMIGGNTSFDTGKWHQTVWEKIVPVDMMEFGFGHQWNRVRPVFPETAFSHPILQLDSDPARNRRAFAAHPKFEGFHDIRRAKPGATVLAVREGTSAPLIAVQTYGKGRSMAFLSDSSGGWGTEYQNQWGPELLGVKERARSGDDAPAQPEKPNQYYSRFWVNTVSWLAEKSVRRQHKEIIGRSEAISYRPGEVVKVAASLPGVFDSMELPKQTIGARLALEGEARVRLSYDRDRKEFIGQLKLPETIKNSEVAVIFDSTNDSGQISDEVRLRVMQRNLELENPRPDAQFMADLAQAGGGAVLDQPDEARAFFQKHRREMRAELAPYSEPLWSRAWVWTALLALFATEWILRRLAAP